MKLVSFAQIAHAKWSCNNLLGRPARTKTSVDILRRDLRPPSDLFERNRFAVKSMLRRWWQTWRGDDVFRSFAELQAAKYGVRMNAHTLSELNQGDWLSIERVRVTTTTNASDDLLRRLTEIESPSYVGWLVARQSSHLVNGDASAVQQKMKQLPLRHASSFSRNRLHTSIAAACFSCSFGFDVARRTSAFV